MENKDIEARLMEALERMEEHDGKVVIFTEAQAQALTEVAKWWMAIRGVTMIGGALGSGVKWLAFMIGAWLALKAGLLDWIAQNIGGGS